LSERRRTVIRQLVRAQLATLGAYLGAVKGI